MKKNSRNKRVPVYDEPVGEGEPELAVGVECPKCHKITTMTLAQSEIEGAGLRRVRKLLAGPVTYMDPNPCANCTTERQWELLEKKPSERWRN